MVKNVFIKLNAVIILVIITNLCLAQDFNRPVPETLFNYEFEQISNNGVNSGYYFLTPFKLRPQNTQTFDLRRSALLLDSDGYVFWYHVPVTGICVDFKYYPQSKLYSVTNPSGPNPVSFIIMDSSLTIIDTVNAVNLAGDIHDIQELQNGNWLVSTIHVDTADLTGYTFLGQNGMPNTPIKGYGFQEIDASGAVLMDWNSNDYIHPSETYDEYGYDSSFFDYCHGNTLEEDTDGNILISFRHLNAIYKVNRLTGDVMWRLGGKSSDFTFINDSLFSGQHDIRRIENGNYSLFDNGNMSPLPKISRGVEYQLDTINWTATLVKEYVHPDSVYGSAMGSYQTTTNNSKILGYGLVMRPDPNITIIDSDEMITSQIFFEDSVVSYRAYHFTPDLPERPQITCEQTLTGWILNAPNASEWQWSTGETSASIMVTEPDTVQVWIPFGAGFIGSEPLIINDVSNPCGSLSLNELTTSKSSDFSLYNLLGQPIKKPEKNKIYLKVYSSGQIERIIHIED